MPLISSSDQERLRESFAEMTRPVRLLFFTQTLDCETCLQTRQILDELPPLSDKIAIEEVNLILEGDTAKAYGIDRAPAIAVTYEENGSVGRHAHPLPRRAGRLRVHLAGSGRVARRRTCTAVVRRTAGRASPRSTGP